MNSVPPLADLLTSARVADRRHDPRYALCIEVTMKGDNNFYTGLSEDISDGGVFIATHAVLPVGTQVAIWFTMPTSDAPLAVIGTVRWVRECAALATGESIFCMDQALLQVKPGMGIEFHDVTDVARSAIRDFMRRRRPDFFE